MAIETLELLRLAYESRLKAEDEQIRTLASEAALGNRVDNAISLLETSRSTQKRNATVSELFVKFSEELHKLVNPMSYEETGRYGVTAGLLEAPVFHPQDSQRPEIVDDLIRTGLDVDEEIELGLQPVVIAPVDPSSSDVQPTQALVEPEALPQPSIKQADKIEEEIIIPIPSAEEVGLEPESILGRVYDTLRIKSQRGVDSTKPEVTEIIYPGEEGDLPAGRIQTAFSAIKKHFANNPKGVVLANNGPTRKPGLYRLQLVGLQESQQREVALDASLEVPDIQESVETPALEVEIAEDEKKIWLDV